MNKILDVFYSYTEAWLEYVNNFVTIEKFTEHYDLNEDCVKRLIDARNLVKPEESWREIDFFYNILHTIQWRQYLKGDDPVEYKVKDYKLILDFKYAPLVSVLHLHGWRYEYIDNHFELEYEW